MNFNKKYCNQMVKPVPIIFAMVLSLVSIVWWSCAFGFSFSEPQKASSAVTAVEPNFVKLFSQASLSVVNISTLSIPKEENQYNSDQLPDVFRKFFDIPAPEKNQPPVNKTPRLRSLGSGFIISKDGYILTNYHVVDGADQIIVKLKDRRELKAKLIGYDKRSDIALLKIKAKGDLPVAKIGNSDQLKPGQWVAAIGSPFNFQYSITKGIVSALDRNLPGDVYVPFIQTDVPINPGNSGGPLLDMQGNVVGINSQIISQSGGFMGLSFSIPIDHAMWVVKQLKKGGKVTRAWLGITMQNISWELAQSFKLDKPSGALVTQIVKKGPAEKAGLKPGDVITAYDDKPIYSSGDLPALIGTSEPNSSHKLTVIRDGKLKKITVKLGVLPAGMNLDNSSDTDSPAKKLGVVVSKITPALVDRFNIPADVRGVIVTQSSNNGLSGLLVGDLITNVGRTAIKSVDQFDKIVQGLKAKDFVSLRIMRNGSYIYVTVQVP